MSRVLPAIRPACFLVCAWLAPAQSQAPVFRTDVNLQSIAVQVTDKEGRDMRGLSAADFTILEDGHPQKISFFGAEDQPISLVVLLDSSSSMESSRKLEGARTLLSPLLHGNRPEDEVFLAPFTNRVGAFQQLTADHRVSPPAVGAASLEGGTALYDALATGLCNLRTAVNVRQAVVVITDGADQHSRLRLQQLIQLAQSSKPQIFMIGFFDKSEYDYYRQSGKTVTLVSGREIDNPLQVFDRIARETGAESFFPASERDLQQVIGHILGILQAQYTVAYYPQDPRKFRRIQVKVNRGGVNVAARHSVGSEGTNEELVHFSATTCEVSPAEHPYPWEPHITRTPPTFLYHDDFSDPRSGWPNRAGSRYVQGGYELSRVTHVPKSAGAEGIRMGSHGGDLSAPEETVAGGVGEGILAAYGPWWRNFRASVSMEGSGAAARGMVFRLGYDGCYVLLFSGTEKAKDVSFKLVKKLFPSYVEVPLIPWTHITAPALAAGGKNRITVESILDRITILLNGVQVTDIEDPSFTQGYLGMAHYGLGRTLFHDLRVESLP
ncbi:MAG TPA: VWA domain-containing protein [Bryobacteraceae bacterium]